MLSINGVVPYHVNTRGDDYEFAPHILNMNGIEHRSFRSFTAAMDQLKYDICSGDLLTLYNLVQRHATALSSKQNRRRRKLNEEGYIPERMPNDGRYQGYL